MPPSSSGLVDAISPSARRGSGIEKISSVGSVAMWRTPARDVTHAAPQMWRSASPIRRSVPGPS